MATERRRQDTEKRLTSPADIPDLGRNAHNNAAVREVATKALESGWIVTDWHTTSGGHYLRIKYPNVGHMTIMIAQSWAREYIGFDFARYSILPHHNGIIDRQDHTAYVSIYGVDREPASTFELFGLSGSDRSLFYGRSVDNIVVQLGSEADGRRIDLHFANNEVGLVTGRSASPCPSMAISLDKDLSIDDPEAVTELLNRVGSAVCFELECRTGIKVRLARQASPSSRAAEPDQTHAYSERIRLPRNNYDSDALALYLEAGNSARSTNRYLLYYQVLEYFFDQAIRAEAQESVERSLRDPRFDFGGQEQVREIVRQAQRFTSSANERQQLKIVIGQIADPAQIGARFAEHGAVGEFLGAKKQGLKGVGRVRISADNPDLVSELSGRVYAIRNRVVHAKRYDSYTDSPPLWPTSPEAQLLRPDVEVVAYLAQRALIRYSGSAGW